MNESCYIMNESYVVMLESIHEVNESCDTKKDDRDNRLVVQNE